MDDLLEPIERRRAQWLLALVLTLILYCSLYPFTFLPEHRPILAWTWSRGFQGAHDIVINLVLYVPAGFLGYAACPATGRGSRIIRATLMTAVVSGIVECLQSFDKGRVSSMPDLLLNVAGGAAGAIAASPAPTRIPAPLTVIVLAMVARTYPFYPHLHTQWTPFRIDQALFATVDWLAIRWALAALMKRDAVTLQLAALQLVLLARIFIADQVSSWSEIAGALLALAIGQLWFNRRRLQAGYLAAVSLITVIARELLPFHFDAAPQAFHWIPFETFLQGSPAVPVLFLSKISLYASTIWLLDPGARQMGKVSFVVATLIAMLEWIQRYLPGRTPDITDPILVLIAAGAISALHPRVNSIQAGTRNGIPAVDGTPTIS